MRSEEYRKKIITGFPGEHSGELHERKVLVLENDTREEALIRSTKISDAVQSLVGGLKVKPAFVVAKGGITSSDVGTKALKVKKPWPWARSSRAFPSGKREKKAGFRASHM